MTCNNPPETPLRDLICRIAAAPFLIVKERATELDTIRNKHDIEIEVDCEKSIFRFSVDTESALITIGLVALERLWCYCYAFHFLHSWQSQYPQSNGFSGDVPALAPVFALLRLVRESETQKKRVEWSDDLPRPDRNTESCAIQNAGALLIYVTCFMLLHEIAHIALGHPMKSIYLTPDDEIKQENKADDWASDFMMGEKVCRAPDSEEFIHRANGIATALALLSTVELDINLNQVRTHPIVPDRLLRFFCKYIPDQQEPEASLREFPKYFATMIIYAILQQRDIPFDYENERGNFFDLLIEVRSLF